MRQSAGIKSSETGSKKHFNNVKIQSNLNRDIKEVQMKFFEID